MAEACLSDAREVVVVEKEEDLPNHADVAVLCGDVTGERMRAARTRVAGARIVILGQADEGVNADALLARALPPLDLPDAIEALLGGEVKLTGMRYLPRQDGNENGTKYQPCIPCVLMSGGKWGTETNEDIPSEASDYEVYKEMMGTHPYSIKIDRATTDLDDSIYYTEKGATYAHGIRSARCATYEAMKYTGWDDYKRLNKTIPFSESLGSGFADTGMGSVLSGAIELGPSDVCMFWGYSYGSRYNKGTYLKNCDVPFCLKSTVMHNMVFIPKQDVKKTLYSSSVPKQRVSFNFNNDPGTLLCCTLGDENIRESGSLLECIAINPRS